MPEQSSENFAEKLAAITERSDDNFTELQKELERLVKVAKKRADSGDDEKEQIAALKAKIKNF